MAMTTSEQEHRLDEELRSRKPIRKRRKAKPIRDDYEREDEHGHE